MELSQRGRFPASRPGVEAETATSHSNCESHEAEIETSSTSHSLHLSPSAADRCAAADSSSLEALPYSGPITASNAAGGFARVHDALGT